MHAMPGAMIYSMSLLANDIKGCQAASPSLSAIHVFLLSSSSTALLQSCLFQTTHLRNHTQGYFVLEPVRPGPDRKKLTLLLVIETRSVS